MHDVIVRSPNKSFIRLIHEIPALTDIDARRLQDGQEYQEAFNQSAGPAK